MEGRRAVTDAQHSGEAVSRDAIARPAPPSSAQLQIDQPMMLPAAGTADRGDANDSPLPAVSPRAARLASPVLSRRVAAHAHGRTATVAAPLVKGGG